MSTPPDDPIRRPAPLAPVDDGLLLEEVRDQIRSLKTAVVLLGLLAVVALAIAAWALLANQGDDGTTTRRGASPARVAALERQVSDLESRVRGAPSKSDLSALRDRQKPLAERVNALEKAGDDAASQQWVDQLQPDVEDLQKRVDEIEQQQQQDQGATP